MKFDYIVIGGGLCGLAAGIKLQNSGKKTAVISSGQSALHFCSGSFGLLGKTDNSPVTNPLEAIKNLPANHPYKLIGEDKISGLANEAKQMLEAAGIPVKGDATQNHYTLTPFGTIKPSWLTMEEYACFDEPQAPFKKVLAIAFKGFLEAYPTFIEENLSKAGISVRIETIDFAKLEMLRKSNFDMRTVTVAKHVDEAAVDELANKINSIAEKDEVVLLPAVVGFKSPVLIEKLKKMVKNELYAVPTLPVSLAGVRSQNLLERYYESLGGTFLLGDRAIEGDIKNGKVLGIKTTNLGEDVVKADAYILATGSLFGEGILSDPNGFKETVFGLNVKVPENREEWYDDNFFAAQPYMNFGVEVDTAFHPEFDGKRVENLYVAGSTLANCNALEEESGAGCAMLTGIYVAELVSK